MLWLCILQSSTNKITLYRICLLNNNLMVSNNYHLFHKQSRFIMRSRCIVTYYSHTYGGNILDANDRCKCFSNENFTTHVQYNIFNYSLFSLFISQRIVSKTSRIPFANQIVVFCKIFLFSNHQDRTFNAFKKYYRCEDKC